MKLFLSFASGPLTFLFLYLLPYEAPSLEGRLSLAIFGWIVMWWMAQPVPWFISSLLPLLLFPAFRLMTINETVGLYGQNIFFWIMGTILLGYAMHRHGLAKRFALWFMSLPVVSGSTRRLIFGFMLVSALVSTMVSDAATVAMMIPVGISLAAFVRSVMGTASGVKSNFGACLALGALYGAEAGGTATIAGIPHNALAVAMLERLTGRTLGWFEWMFAGVPLFIFTLIAFYFILLWFLPPEADTVPGGEAFLQEERKKLGPMSPAERSTLYIFVAMVLLFTIPTVVRMTLGSAHPITEWTRVALSVWMVPPTILLLLFMVPVNWRKGEFVLTWKDAAHNTPWDIMILCTAAVAVTGALVKFGFIDFAGKLISSLGLGQYSLPFVSAAIVAFGTNVISGTAATTFFGSILIPAAQEIGWNPASMAMLIPNVALGFMLPWAGAAAGTAFATGEIDMKNMIRIGAVSTVVVVVLRAGLHILLAPYL